MRPKSVRLSALRLCSTAAPAVLIMCLENTAGCGVFGRDEGDSEFSFTQHHVNILVDKWSQTVRAAGFNAVSKPSSSTINAVELCISDRNKPLLLASTAFIPYVVDALLLVRAEL